MNALNLLSLLLGTAFLVSGALCLLMVGAAIEDIVKLKKKDKGQNFQAAWLFLCAVLMLWGAVRLLLGGGGL